MTALDAVEKVLGERGKPLHIKELTWEILRRGLWESTGKTPHQTILSGLLRNIRASHEQGLKTRFVRTGPGTFALAAPGTQRPPAPQSRQRKPATTASKEANPTLVVENFAQIRSAKVEFGDLTILVGPQGSGKSLILQLFKLAVDSGEVIPALREAGHDVAQREELLDVYFGQGMHHAWNAHTRIHLDGRQLHPESLDAAHQKASRGRVFYIPAHRALLLAGGWPAPFQSLNADTPAVARLFSQNLYSLVGNPRDAALFPAPGQLKEEYRELIDAAVFHGGKVQLGKEALRRRLELRFGEARLPFMTWTAGQREFTPLLLGFYHLLPPAKERKQPDIDWVVLEEPEMGLHPQALTVVMLLVLDLLWRGYRVIVSTHAPLVADIVFAIGKLKELNADPRLLCDAFHLKKNHQTMEVMKAALEKSYRTFYMSFNEGLVESRDISRLDPFSEVVEEAEWGGLTGFSSRFNEIVARAVNAAAITHID